LGLRLTVLLLRWHLLLIDWLLLHDHLRLL
jgi:hypothetical protein